MSRKYNAMLAVMGAVKLSSVSSGAGESWRECDEDACDEDENERALMGVARGGASWSPVCDWVAAVMRGIGVAISRKPK
jgi:hypothetical protein